MGSLVFAGFLSALSPVSAVAPANVALAVDGSFRPGPVAGEGSQRIGAVFSRGESSAEKISASQPGQKAESSPGAAAPSEGDSAYAESVAAPVPPQLAVGSADENIFPVAVTKFQSVGLTGAARVILRYGASQGVRIVRGQVDMANLMVDARGRLQIRGCESGCSTGELVIEVTTPQLSAVEVKGEGTISAESGFPLWASMAVALEGPGTIDIRALDVKQVAASLSGEGRILTRPRSELIASILGDGFINYWGDARVSSSIIGKGLVSHMART
jgi:hypothetical protein